MGYSLRVMWESACLVISTITVDNFAALFNCTPGDRASDSMMTSTWSYSFKLLVVGTGLFGPPGSTYDILLLQSSRGVVWQSRYLKLSRNTLYLLSPRRCFFIVFNRDLFVIDELEGYHANRTTK